MEQSNKGNPPGNKQGPAQRMYCGECRAQITDEKGAFLVGKFYRDHTCFAGCTKFSRLGQHIYRTGSEKMNQVLARSQPKQHHLVQQNRSLSSQSSSNMALSTNPTQQVNLHSVNQRRLSEHNSGGPNRVPPGNIVSHEQTQSFDITDLQNQMRARQRTMNVSSPLPQHSHNDGISADFEDEDNSLSSSGNSLHNISNSHESQASNDSDPITWTLPMTKLLCQSYLKFKKEKETFKSKKQLYKKISIEFNVHKYNVPWEKVGNKIKRLEVLYKNKVDNKSSRQSGTSRLDVECEELLEQMFGKKHSINPTHLVGSHWEQSNSASESEELLEMGRSTDPAGAGDHNTNENRNGMNESCTKKREYNYTLAASENQVRQQHHQENLRRKDTYIELKTKELEMKRETKQKELELKEKTKTEFLKLKRMELFLKAQKYNVNLPDENLHSLE